MGKIKKKGIHGLCVSYLMSNYVHKCNAIHDVQTLPCGGVIPQLICTYTQVAYPFRVKGIIVSSFNFFYDKLRMQIPVKPSKEIITSNTSSHILSN